MSDWKELPFGPEPGTALCTLAGIPENGAKEVVSTVLAKARALCRFR